jgi:uncharacterized protein YodC (DUF2158 family)
VSEKLQVGDVVRLKSGGPTMTVTGLDEYGQAHVSWFDTDGKANHGMWMQAALERVS